MATRMLLGGASATEYVTRARASEITGRDVRTVDRWADAGLITRYKLGGRQWVRFKVSELEEMMRPVPVDSVELTTEEAVAALEDQRDRE